MIAEASEGGDMATLALPTGTGAARDSRLREFAASIRDIGKRIGDRVSSRGWCYLLEGFRLINKDHFDRVESVINECRAKGYLPIDFTAEEESRGFSGVENLDPVCIESQMQAIIEELEAKYWLYTPEWWEGEKYYIQMVVEKIDLKTLFEPVCHEYHIPIATSKGWSSMLQRATYARRFKEAQEMGLSCVLLYCGDHDPDGLRISTFLRKNLKDLQTIQWLDGMEGYDPEDLIIDRFGLNFDFIEANRLTWIDNLITGSGGNLADPNHRNNRQPYVQEYLRTIGVRKCEANALIVRREAAEALCRQTIERYLGEGARARFARKQATRESAVDEYKRETGLDEAIRRVLAGSGE